MADSTLDTMRQVITAKGRATRDRIVQVTAGLMYAFSIASVGKEATLTDGFDA